MKQKYLFLFSMLTALALPTYGQNKIGDNPTVIQSGSLLELESLTKGFRLPRIQLNNLNAWTLDGIPVSGMVIFNDSGTAAKGIYYWNIDLSQWVQVVNKSELSTLIANSLNQNTTVRDSIVRVINNAIISGTIQGNNLTSNSSVLTVQNGVGSTIKATQVDLDKNELGHLLNTSPVSDSIKSIIDKATTNILKGASGKLTSIVNGVSADLALTNGTIVKGVGFDASGNLVTSGSGSTPTTNILDNTLNTITSTVNGIAATAPAVNTVVNTSSVNSLITNVNGVVGASVPMINSNTVSNPTINTVRTTINNVPATTDATIIGTTTVSNPTINTVRTTINGVAATTDATIIGSNTFTATNGNLVSKVNGVATTPAVPVLISATMD